MLCVLTCLLMLCLLQAQLSQRSTQRVQRQVWTTWRSRYQEHSRHFRLLNGTYISRRRKLLTRVVRVSCLQSALYHPLPAGTVSPL